MATPRRDEPGMPRRSSSRLKRKKEEDTSQPITSKKQAHLKEETSMELDPIDTTQAASTQVKRKKPFTTRRSSSRLKGKREDRDQPPVEKQEHQPPMKSLDEALPGTSQDADISETPAARRQQELQSSAMPTRFQFLYIKDNVGLKWVNLARMLGFSEEHIEVFKEMHRNPTESCMAMLTDWKQNTGVDGTVHILKEGLKNAGLNIIADNLDLYMNTYRVEKLTMTSYTWPASDNERITEQEKQKKRETQKAGIDNQTGENQHIVQQVQQYMEKNYPGLKRESQAAASTSDEPVNTHMFPESTCNVGEISLQFHEKVHGTQISISGNGTVAQSCDSFSNSICFSKMPIKIGEKVNFKIIDSQAHDDSLRFGVTSRSPDSILVEDLPPHSYPDLAEWSRFWVKPLPGSQAHQGCVVTFSVEQSGKVTFAVDGEDKGLFFSGVNVSKPLWAVVDVHGSARAVQFVDEQTACKTSDQWIHEGDQVQLRELQKDKLRDMQSGREFDSSMMEAKGEVGIVGHIDNDGDMHVFFPSISKGWCISPAVLKKVKRPDVRANTIFGGDLVKITEDLGKLKSVQQDKDLWKDGMEKTIGKTARVRGISRTRGDFVLRVSGKDWVFDPQVLERSKAESQGEICGQDLHYWKRGVSKVCVKCSECTADGARCSMKGKPLRPPGSCCGCRSNNAGCAECGICRSCAGEESDGDTVLDHLTPALLGPIIAQAMRETLSSLISGGAKDKDTEHFKKGDLVRLIKNHERLKALQQSGGGFVDDMESCLGKTGCVKKVRQSGLVLVEFLHVAKSYWYNPAALSKVSSEEQEISTVHQLKRGDCVKVAVDAETFKANQCGHGGNVDNMAEVLETVGVVCYIDLDGDSFTCFLNGTRWPINPASLEKVNPEDNMYTGVDSSSQLKVDDWVKVDADKVRIKQVQTAKATIDWDDAFYAPAGKVGTVTSINPSDKIVRVKISDAGFPLDSTLVKRASLADLREHFNLSQNSDFARGDLVRISVSLDELKHLQEGHGGYKPDMEKVMAEAGSVCFIDSEGDIYVRFDIARLCFNPAALSKVTATEDKLYVGDLVRIESDLSKFEALQTPKEHGGYVEQMAETCGKAGRLVSIVDSKKMRVKVQGRSWIYNPDLLTRMGNPRAVTEDWKSATICARGKHDWSRGRCLVCVMCGECTDDGKLCPALRKLNMTLAAGSVAGCGDGHAGCDDCGCCKACAGEEMEEIDVLESDEFKVAVIKILKDEVDKKIAVDDVKTTVTKHRLSESSGQLNEGRKKMLDLLDKMGEVIEMVRKNKDPDSIEQVMRALSQHIDIPRTESSPVERKQIGDYLANIGAAEALMEYGRFVLSQEVQIEGTDGRISSESYRKFFYDVFNGCAYASLEFARAAGRSGLLQTTVQELEQRQEMEESDDKQEWIRTLVCILGNCARVPENRDYFTDTGAVDLLKKQLKASNEDIVLKVVTLSCLAYLLDDEMLETIQLQTEDVDFIVNKLTQAVGDANHECFGYENKKWHAVDLVRDLTALARHDGNKREFVRKGVIDPLIQLIECGNDTEKECAMLCVQRFAITVESIRETLLNETRVVEVLTALQTQDQLYAVQAAARKTLKCLRNEPSST